MPHSADVQHASAQYIAAFQFLKNVHGWFPELVKRTRLISSARSANRSIPRPRRKLRRSSAYRSVDDAIGQWTYSIATAPNACPPSCTVPCATPLIASPHARKIGARFSTASLDAMRKITWLLPFLLVAGTVVGPLIAGEQSLEFTPQNGFGGESEGQGSLKLFLGKPRAFYVTSRGSEQSDGTFRLDQTVTFQGEAPQQRFWILSTTSHNRYSATLSDAAGPVEGLTSGSHLSLRYRASGPLIMHQELELSPDGKTIDNIGVITLLGIPVGHLHEAITRKRPGITPNY